MKRGLPKMPDCSFKVWVYFKEGRDLRDFSPIGCCLREVWGGWTPPPHTRRRHPDSPDEV